MHSAPNPAAMAVDDAQQAIWNPLVAAAWSLVFSPAFGAYLLMRNWEALGEARQAAQARIWLCISLGLLGIQLLSSAINRRLNSDSTTMHWIALAFLLAWLVSAVVPQVRLVRSRFGAAGYRHKGWHLALFYAAAAGLGYFLARAAITFLIVAAT